MNKTSRSLGEYVRDVFDINRDGRVTLKEFFSAIVPSQSVGLALIAVDLLAIIGEYRVWEVGMYITNNDPYSALGFVAISLVPFYLAQILWLYPLATGWQQAVAVVMLLTSLVTSMQFGFADLSQTYNVVVISKWVTRLWFFYIVLLLVYVLIDKNFKLLRSQVQARANARYRDAMNQTISHTLEGLERSLAKEQELRARYGDEAVDAHLELLRASGGVAGSSNGHRAPAPNPTEPPRRNP